MSPQTAQANTLILIYPVKQPTGPTAEKQKIRKPETPTILDPWM
jgi:hypothetical protein